MRKLNEMTIAQNNMNLNNSDGAKIEMEIEPPEIPVRSKRRLTIFPGKQNKSKDAIDELLDSALYTRERRVRIFINA